MLKISRNWFNRSKLSYLSWLGVAGVVSCFIFVLTLGVMLFPSLPDSVQAVEGDSGASTYATGTSVSIGVPATIAFDAVTPTASGVTTTANANLTIATTNSASYSLYLYSSDGDNSLKSINPANTSTVDAINNGGVGLTLSSLEPNTWGYSLGTSEPTDTTTYSAVPTSNAAPIQTKDTSSTNSANDTYTLSFGAKVDTTIPSGIYAQTLTIAVVAEPGGTPVTYNANGGYFNNDPAQTTQMISYVIEGNPETKIAKTSNISDDGVQSGGYGDNVSDIQTVTIPGAQSLKVTVTYQTESTSYDWLAIYDGSVTPSQSNHADSITGKLGGTTKVDNAVFTIPGDTAQFYFYSDDYPDTSNYYGYYATVHDSNFSITSNTELQNPTRPGYDFLGWYTDITGTEGSEFVIDGSLQATTVYAKWGINYLDDVTYMQDLTITQCTDSYNGATATLLDRRDNSDYTITKINGTCWMTQNLRLPGGRTLTPADSNVASNWFFPTAQPTGSYTEPQAAISDNTSYGGYYNFCAASAGTICRHTITTNATSDICPRGWRLPTNTEQNNVTSYLSTFSPVYSGRYHDDSLINDGSSGYWWSSSYDDEFSDQYYLSYFEGLLKVESFNGNYGVSIRCVLSS